MYFLAWRICVWTAARRFQTKLLCRWLPSTAFSESVDAHSFYEPDLRNVFDCLVWTVWNFSAASTWRHTRSRQWRSTARACTRWTWDSVGKWVWRTVQTVVLIFTPLSVNRDLSQVSDSALAHLAPSLIHAENLDFRGCKQVRGSSHNYPFIVTTCNCIVLFTLSSDARQHSASGRASLLASAHSRALQLRCAHRHHGCGDRHVLHTHPVSPEIPVWWI